ncbi:MAG: YdeI/OmpD-associated family protein [Pseudomonadota bacterium]
MITTIDDYFSKGCGRCPRFQTADCAARKWSNGLTKLRQICRDVGLTETLKWAHPCYMHADRNVTIIGAFRDDFRLSFFNAALLKDPDGVLERQGPNTPHPDVMRFLSSEEVDQREPVIRAYLAEAMTYAKAGITPAKDASMPDYPDELIEALDADPALAEAFHALSRGRQKSYLINLNGAKQARTRINRIAKFRDKIIAGKGALER